MSPVYSTSQMTGSKHQWYHGDFHAHTNFSDGTYPPPELVELAKSEGLDFLAITDHNTCEAFTKIAPDPGILLLRGIEVTLRHGDMNVFGVDERFDWMDQICVTTKRIPRLEGKYQTTTDLMRQISSQHLVISMNHPLLKPWEWRDSATQMGYLNCIEICNDPSWADNASANPMALALWTDLLNAGYRMAAIGGSDYHRPVPKPGDVKPPERLGLPSTYVLAGELSSPAILDALRLRHAYVTMGPRLSFQARVDGVVYEIGDDVGTAAGAIEFSATLNDLPESAHALIVKNGQVVSEIVPGKAHAEMQCRDQVNATQSIWFRLEARGRDGEMLAITNPIFAGPVREIHLKTYGDFVHDLAH